ncbi:hypothetical protein ACFUC1_15480 [Pedococcus sp. NPDC057267]|uniref:hypothetical protein n=1 Tax=Pedococcus sp. NPDC057267 TaxID=3346077 RepID=UPI0036380C6E
MSEPSSGVPSEIADAEVERPDAEREGRSERVELDVDEEKLEAWDKVKGDYQVEPGGEPVPNSQEERVAPGDDDQESDGAPGPS